MPPSNPMEDWPVCPHPGCGKTGHPTWTGYCGPEHREAYFESLGAGNCIESMWPQLVEARRENQD